MPSQHQEGPRRNRASISNQASAGLHRTCDLTPKTLRTDGTSICDLTSALQSTIQGCERVSQEGMREASPDSQRRLHPDTAHPLHVLPFVFGFPLTSNVSLEGQISPALFLSSLFPLFSPFLFLFS